MHSGISAFNNLKLFFTWFWKPKLWFFFLYFCFPAAFFFVLFLWARRDGGEKRKWLVGKGSSVKLKNSIWIPPRAGVFNLWCREEVSSSDIASHSCCWWCLTHNKTVSTWTHADTHTIFMVKSPASVSLFSVYLQGKCRNSILVFRFDRFNYSKSLFFPPFSSY